MYESVKARLEAEEAAAAEEQRLLDLLRAEEVAAKARKEAAQRAARQAELRASMLADNRAQLAHKVGWQVSACSGATDAPCNVLSWESISSAELTCCACPARGLSGLLDGSVPAHAHPVIACSLAQCLATACWMHAPLALGLDT